jgi:hypothetical protein
MRRVQHALSGLVLGVLIGVLAGCGSQAGSGKVVLLAQVGSQKITSTDLDEALNNLPDSYKPLVANAKGKRQILDNLVKKALMVQEAEARGLGQKPAVRKQIHEFQTEAATRLEKQLAEIKRRMRTLDRQIYENVLLSELNAQLKSDTAKLKAVSDLDIDAYYQEYAQKLKALNPAAQVPSLASVEDKIRAILVEDQLLKDLEKKLKVAVQEDTFRQRYGEKQADVTIQDSSEQK